MAKYQFFSIPASNRQQYTFIDMASPTFLPEKEALLAQGFALADGRLLPERYLTLAYDSFEQAKRKLWEAFPEIADFSGNSILRMNECTFNRMCKFAENVFDIVE